MIAALIIIVSYSVLLLILLKGWLQVIGKKEMRKEEIFISVIVAVRNEEKNIQNLLDRLCMQEYASYEIIIVDDHSNDGTEQLIHDFNSPLVKCVENEGSGKKHAITTGVAIASGEIIATTDADCIPPPKWLKAINDHFSENTAFAFGGVSIEGEGNFFSHLQQLEYAALIGTAASGMAYGFPTMCSGANMAFRKSIFQKVDGYEGNFLIPSGDDEFLMRKINRSRLGKIKFIADPGAVVRTHAESTLSDFIQQRLRWAGKWRYNSSIVTVSLALFIFVVQLAVLFSFFKLIQTREPVWIFLLAGKLLCELLLVSSFCRFLNIRFRLPVFFVLFLIYPFYSLFVGTVANFSAYRWKERYYKR